MIGCDIFTREDCDANTIGHKLVELTDGIGIELTMSSYRAQKVYPGGHPETFLTDHCRCDLMQKMSA